MIQNILSKMFYAATFVAVSTGAVYAQGTIATIAGGGSTSLASYGDGGPAIAANLSGPSGVTGDASGNIYIADKYNSRIRMISAATGNISTVAGSSTGGYLMTGMGGPATSANLIYPNAVAVDNFGNVYASDWYADAAYKLSTSGLIYNICGHDSQGCSGDGGPGPDATMCIPGGVAVDNSGNVYIADYGNSRIRRVDGTTGIVTTIAGGTWGPALTAVLASTATFGQINGVCVDGHGDIYISDAGNHCVRMIAPSGIIRTIAGTAGVSGYSGDGGPSLSATLSSPGCLFINSAGNLFICDADNNCVRVMNMGTGIIHTLAGTGAAGFSGDGGSATSATLNQPSGVWEDAGGTIYIADAGNNRIRKITGSGYKAAGTATFATNNVSIFPNPSTGTFIVQTDATPDNGDLDIYNVAGEKVYSGKMDQQQVSVSLNQPAGIYNVVYKTASGTTTQKVTITH